jgi:2-hydroxychromene-2-carboxylate isomerase
MQRSMFEMARLVADVKGLKALAGNASSAVVTLASRTESGSLGDQGKRVSAQVVAVYRAMFVSELELEEVTGASRRPSG